ncbi:MAG: hypothetical protein WCP01_11520 [Methylococcaceae bacterium]
MSGRDATRQGKPGSGYNRACLNSNQIIPKYAAFGKLLAERMQFKNPPILVIIEVGGDAWKRAKNWQRHAEFAALILTPEADPKRLIWPVCSCPCLIEWGAAAPETLIINLIACLLRSGAAFVSVIPLFVDWNTQAEYFDVSEQKWHKAREIVRTYYPRKEVRNVA